MKNLLIFTCEDGTKITFDEYVHEKEDGHNYYWVTMCRKCLGKYQTKLGHRVCDYGSGCCSVCGCDTPDDVDCETEEELEAWDSRYVDFTEDEVEEI